jgi:hypothetical protein
VLFVHATGDTHALGPAASAALATLLEQQGISRTADAWYELLAGEELNMPDVGQGQTSAGVSAFEQLLAGLEGIGVVSHEDP